MTERQLERKARFKIVIKALDIDRQVLADRLGYKKKYIDQVLSADKNLSDAMLLKFTKWYKEVNEEWLSEGKGDMLLPSNAVTGEEIKKPVAVYETPGEPLEMLRVWMESFESRIKELEAEVRRMKGEMGE